MNQGEKTSARVELGAAQQGLLIGSSGRKVTDAETVQPLSLAATAPIAKLFVPVERHDDRLLVTEYPAP